MSSNGKRYVFVFVSFYALSLSVSLFSRFYYIVFRFRLKWLIECFFCVNREPINITMSLLNEYFIISSSSSFAAFTLFHFSHLFTQFNTKKYVKC